MTKLWMALTGVTVLLAGCEATTGGGLGGALASAGSLNNDAKQEAYADAVQSWKGHSTAELKNAWGKAMGAQQGDTGKIWLVYFKEYSYGGGEYRVEQTHNIETPVPGGGTMLQTQTTLDGYGSRTKQVKRKCLTRFQINGDGVIETVESDGQCRPSDMSDDQMPGS